MFRVLCLLIVMHGAGIANTYGQGTIVKDSYQRKKIISKALSQTTTEVKGVAAADTPMLEVKHIKDPIVKNYVKFWEYTVIPVCWENPETWNLKSRAVVENAIKETWQKESKLNFDCWCACSEKSKGVRIKISDEQPGLKYKEDGKLKYGSYIDGKKNALVLNFAFRKWGSTELAQKMNGDTAKFIKALAVHEFGHVLGFAHENERPDCDFCDDYDEMKKNSIPGVWATPCDFSSVMNYCNPAYCNGGVLSEFNKDAVRQAYGARGGSVAPLYYIAYNIENEIRSSSKLVKELGWKGTTMSQHIPTHENTYNVLFTYYKVDFYIASTNLKAIKEVKYELYPDFEEPVVYRNNAKESFGYSVYCWGQFKLVATIKFLDPNQPPLKIEKDLKALKDATVTILGSKKIKPVIKSVGGENSKGSFPRSRLTNRSREKMLNQRAPQ